MKYITYSKEYGPLALLGGYPPQIAPEDDVLYIPCEDDADVNDRERWDGEATFMIENGYTAPTLELAQELKRGELMRMRNAIVEQGFAFGGHLYPIGPDIQGTMHLQFTTSQLMPAPSYSWKDIQGIYRFIGDAAAFQTFIMAALMYGQSLYEWEEMLQGLVNEAEDIEAVQRINWDTVPDEPV